jgi:hypothetical protein
MEYKLLKLLFSQCSSISLKHNVCMIGQMLINVLYSFNTLMKTYSKLIPKHEKGRKENPE